jgi:hypothetical protein
MGLQMALRVSPSSYAELDQAATLREIEVIEVGRFPRTLDDALIGVAAMSDESIGGADDDERDSVDSENGREVPDTVGGEDEDEDEDDDEDEDEDDDSDGGQRTGASEAE